MRILISGAFGYLGSRLVEFLSHDLVLGARSRPDWVDELPASGEFCQLDVLEPTQVQRAVADVDVVVHLASLDENEASRDPDLAVRVSAEGTRRMLEASRQAGVSHFLYFSTFHVYGAGAPSELHEDEPVKPSHPYGISRFAGEGYCHENNRLEAKTRAFVFRLSNGYGAPAHRAVDRWSLAHNDFCRQAVESGKIRLRTPGTQHRDFVWVGDVAQAIERVLSAESLPHSLMHLGSGKSLSMRDLAGAVRERAERQLGRSVELEFPQAPRDEHQPHVRYSIERLRSIGFEPHDALATETDRILALLRSRGRAPQHGQAL